MTKSKYFIITLLALFYTACSPSLESIKKFAATEKYPKDKFLDTVSIKRALVIVAHDDDDCAMAGTIAQLHTKGWKIIQLSFVVNKSEKGLNYHPSKLICDGNEPILDDRIYRNDGDSSDLKYMPFPKEKFDQVFLKEKVKNALIAKVNAFNPSVIFTLDNEIGGYGHPDHVFISQLVKDIAQNGQIQPYRIYQSVYTNSMETEIVEKWLTARLESWGYENMYPKAKKVYAVSGMPEPDVEINIEQQAETKMQYLLSYSDDARKNFRKFIPYYEEFDAKTYFSVFNREFFKVIELH